MRILGVAAILSLCVLVGCGVWFHELTTANIGPERSVDFRPLMPIIGAVGALVLIWLLAGIAWIIDLASRHQHAERDEI